MEKRLFLVSDRLPLAFKGTGPEHAHGPLVSVVEACVKSSGVFNEIFWAGVPGCSLAGWISNRDRIDRKTYSYLPVFCQDHDFQMHHRHAGSVLWPLFHSFPSFTGYPAHDYGSYLRVNQEFAVTLIKHLRPGDTVWIHDYHLIPLAALLRKDMPELTIGFFLHLPFPSFDIFRQLPRHWQEELLKGMLGADLIGFHTMDYASHFLQCLLSVLGTNHDRHIIQYDNRLIRVDVFPMGIDYPKFHDAYGTVAYERNKLREAKGHRKMIFSTDRLDETKAVQNRLKAFEHFLAAYPAYHNEVVFYLLVIPGDDHVEQRKRLDEKVRHINLSFGNDQWKPVVCLEGHPSFREMVAYYTACDLALFTPLRDGMNLFAKEFVASRQDKQGVLLISEMAGAARELTDAIIVNPNDITEMAAAIKSGLELPQEEQLARLGRMQARVAGYDMHAWIADFMNALKQIKDKQQDYRVKFLDAYSKSQLFDAYRRSRRRLLLMDYDGTLVSFSSNPDAAIPGSEVIGLLDGLSHNAANDVFVISGRNSEWLEKHFGHLSLHLIAEHGARYKWKNSGWQADLQSNSEWKEQVQQIMEIYERRCPDSFIEEKDFSIVWHYRNAPKDQGSIWAFELAGELNELVRNRHLQVLMGNKIVEVRQTGIDKGSFTKRIIDQKHYDFIFAIGDDRTDEDMFRVLSGRSEAFTIKVGQEASYARFNLHTPQMVLSLLHGLYHMPSEASSY